MRLVERCELSFSALSVGERLSQLDEEWVEALRETLRRSPDALPAIQVARLADGSHRLMAGRHRLEAAYLEGRQSIICDIFEPESDDVEAEIRLHETEENLLRRGLSALDRAAHLAAHKAAYEALHPETRRGVAGASARHHATATFSFAEVTARKLGISRRTIETAVALYNGLAPEMRARLAGTWLADHQRQLQALAELPEYKQGQVVTLMLEGGLRDVAAAEAQLAGDVQPAEPDSVDTAYARLEGAWARAPLLAKERFLRERAAEGWLSDPTTPPAHKRKGAPK